MARVAVWEHPRERDVVGMPNDHGVVSGDQVPSGRTSRPPPAHPLLRYSPRAGLLFLTIGLKVGRGVQREVSLHTPHLVPSASQNSTSARSACNIVYLSAAITGHGLIALN